MPVAEVGTEPYEEYSFLIACPRPGSANLRLCSPRIGRLSPDALKTGELSSAGLFLLLIVYIRMGLELTHFIVECMFMPTASAERILPVDEIIRRLRSLRFDRRPRLTDVAKAAGLHRAQLYNLIGNRQQIQPEWHKRLSHALLIFETKN